MSKSDTPAPPTPARLGQQDLIALALTEKLRRRQVRASLGVGAWATITDPAVADQIGEDIVRVTEVRGSSRVVAAFFNGSSTIVAGDKLKACLASGDIMVQNGHRYVVLDPYPRRTGSDHELAWGMSPQWGIDGAGVDEPSIIELDVRQISAETSINGPVSLITPRVFSERDAYVVRGAIRVDPSLSTLGPNLVVDDFSHVASCAEPCRVRKHEGRIIDDHVDGRRVVLCDFLGGATLWIWAEVLVALTPSTHTVQWGDSPSEKHHPETAKILAPSVHAAAVDAIEMAPPTPPPVALPPAQPPTQPLELSMNTNDKILRNITSGPRLARGTIVIVDAYYSENMKEAVGALRVKFSDEALASTDALEDVDSIRLGEPPLGAYEVRRSDAVELPDGSTFAKITCVLAGNAGSGRYEFISALVRVAAGGALALSPSPDGAVARVAKNVGGKALDVAKDALVGVKDMAVDEGKRKALAFAQVASQDTLVSGHEAVRRTVLAAGAGFMGADNPQAAATNAALAQGFDMLSIGAGKLLARVLEKHAPGTAKMIGAATESLQHGIDQKQAHGVLDQVMPVVGGGLKALAQAAVGRMLPALPAAPAAALPAPTPTPTPEPPTAPSKPKRKRTPKAATSSQNGGAK